MVKLYFCSYKFTNIGEESVASAQYMEANDRRLALFMFVCGRLESNFKSHISNPPTHTSGCGGGGYMGVNHFMVIITLTYL